MIAVVTPEEMRAVDAAAPESVETLIARAGAAVARAALGMLGGSYGRRVVVIAGPGNNGADGRVAGERLSARGVRVSVIEVDRRHPPPPSVPNCDLVVDAAYGTGFRGEYRAPDCGGAPVLAVDIPSGVDGLTGAVNADTEAVRADVTVTFAALKPGLLFGEGLERSGRVEVADIGLDPESAGPIRCRVLEAADVANRLRAVERPRRAHKWHSAVLVLGGSPGMTGAPRLTASAAYRSGAGMVRLAVPGETISAREAVGVALPAVAWADHALAELARCRSLAIGPGLGRAPDSLENVRRVLSSTPVPALIDADALAALAGDGGLAVLRDRPKGASVLTPHDGEFELLTGARPGSDRIAAARALAAAWSSVVLLKGPVTVVASPDGGVELVTAGDQRLATAGSGDVLSGLIAALIAQGLEPAFAASCGAWVHGAAAARGWRRGLVAGDLVDALPAVFDALDSTRVLR